MSSSAKNFYVNQLLREFWLDYQPTLFGIIAWVRLNGTQRVIKTFFNRAEVVVWLSKTSLRCNPVGKPHN